MWVYEGQTQYWGEVLAARSGLWTAQQARDTLARTAALYANRPGGRWRPLSDTTRDPQPLPWPSWQRSEDYYAEGQLLWLEIDTLIRELTGDTRSLDDFARRFFGVEGGRTATCTYVFEDVAAGLNDIAPRDWTGFLTERLESREVGAPLKGLARGGYQLVYRKHPSDFAVETDALQGLHNLRFSIGLSVGDDGTLQEVIWEGPAYRAGLVAGAKLTRVNAEPFTPDRLKIAISEAEHRGGLDVTVQRGARQRTVAIAYGGGHRYPHLKPIEGARPRLDEILASRT
jgi:predicted metalloprotease with PDZ domain